jgi:hypothetical protein
MPLGSTQSLQVLRLSADPGWANSDIWSFCSPFLQLLDSGTYI